MLTSVPASETVPRISGTKQASPCQATLSLGFANDAGTTRLIERSHFGPLRVQKALYPEGPAVCHAIVVHPRVDFSTDWLSEVLRVMNLNQYSLAAAQPGLSVERIEALELPVPNLADQQAIAEAMTAETAETNAAIEIVRQEITLIQEFRTRLIADVVTGQLDVRALAATLPAVTAAAPPGEPDDEAFDEDADALEDEEADA